MKTHNKFLLLATLLCSLMLALGNQVHAAVIVAFVGASAAVPWSAYRPQVFGVGLNFLDLAKANSNDIVGGLIEENAVYVPELAVFPVDDLVEPGVLSYETLHRTSLPTVEFAAAGDGFTPSKSEISLKKHECFRFGGRIEAAKHIADNWRRGGAAGYQAFEASGVMKAAMQLIGKQLFYGVSNGALGFPGLKAFTPFGGAYTLDATGSTATTASSAYYVMFGESYCTLMAGRARNGNGIFDLPDFEMGDMDGANGKKMRAYIAELSSYLGLQIAAEASVVRVCNMTAQTGKGCTDALLNTAKALFPAGFVPNALFMSRRSRTQLQNSRTVVLYGTGTQRPDQGAVAPVPTTDMDGVPLIATDSILNTDAIES